MVLSFLQALLAAAMASYCSFKPSFVYPSLLKIMSKSLLFSSCFCLASFGSRLGTLLSVIPDPHPPLQSLIFDEVDLSDASVAESSTKNVNNSFTVSASFSPTSRVHGQGYMGQTVRATLKK